jgi:hypothetical protein
MTPEERQGLLAEYGLTENECGFGLTLRGLQRGLRRAYEWECRVRRDPRPGRR